MSPESVRALPRATFSLGPIPVRVEPAFFLVAGLLGAGRLSEPLLLMVWIGVVFVSILFHELGHAAVFRAFGHASRIELHGMGGRTRGESRPLSTTGQVLVALGGPVAGFALGLAVVEVGRQVGVESRILVVGFHDLMWVNFGWGGLNLLPMLPLDGGLVALAILRRLGGARGERWATQLSVAIAAAGVAAALWYEMPWAALLAAYFGSESFNRLRGAQREAAAPPR